MSIISIMASATATSRDVVVNLHIHAAIAIVAAGCIAGNQDDGFVAAMALAEGRAACRLEVAAEVP